MENWTEIKITVPVERVDEAGAIASMTVPYGIYIEDYSDLEEQAMAIAKIDLIDEELLRKDGRVMTHVVGTSMWPLLLNRESIVLVETADKLTASGILSKSSCFRT